MNFAKDLAKLKIAIDKELALQFDTVIFDTQSRDPLIVEALRHTKKIALSGGKRIRGALLCQAYFGVGGQEKKKILKAAAAIELIHMFLLIHDDIIDRGKLRHGKQTLNVYFEKKFSLKKKADSEHIGNSIAIIVGDMLYAQALKIVMEAGFDTRYSVKALSQLQATVNTTIIGQSQDIAISLADKIQEKQILAMYENKTARYTFEGPLQLGATLAGCTNTKTLRALTAYAIPLGIAFQIQDDMLGVFSTSSKAGKSTVSDVEEGKKTLMVLKAINGATPEQKKVLESILGKHGITEKEMDEFKNILTETGAFNYCNEIVKEKLVEGKKATTKMILLPEAKKFLIGLAEYLEDREF